jgi:hypothetical protein
MNRLQQLIEETRPTPGPQGYYPDYVVNEWIELLAKKILNEAVNAHSVTDHFYTNTETTDEHNT